MSRVETLLPVEQTMAGSHSVFTAALRGAPCHVVGLSARSHRLPVPSWTGPAGDHDRALLEQCVGATLDIGCGPGRMTEHLVAQGMSVLGIDVVAEAVALTRERGASALVRDVFGPLPGEGRWDTALLADGNIGIGGDPVRLLRRVHQLLAPGGRAVLDVASPGVGLRSLSLTLECDGARSTPFPWSVVGVDAVPWLASEACLGVISLQEYDGRWFAVLGKGS
jgi:SAM-dependent methyltransferase